MYLWLHLCVTAVVRFYFCFTSPFKTTLLELSFPPKLGLIFAEATFTTVLTGTSSTLLATFPFHSFEINNVMNCIKVDT